MSALSTTLTRGPPPLAPRHRLVPLALDGGEHGVGLVRQPALPDHPDGLGHHLTDCLSGAKRRNRKRDEHSPLLSLVSPSLTLSSRPRTLTSRARTMAAARVAFKNHENPWSAPLSGRTLWPSARLRPHNDGMTGSLVAPRHVRRRGSAAGGDASRDTAPAAPGAETGPETRGTPLLTVSWLSLSYGRLRALYDIDLSVRSGELVALAGENGAGKTTLLRCIAGD